MKWKFVKKYLSFNFKEYDYISHVQLPVLHKDWLYFSVRDSQNMSHICRVKDDIFETYLSPAFPIDKKGIMPSCFCEDTLFYTGYIEHDVNVYTQNICSLTGSTRRALITAETDKSFLVNSPFVLNDNSTYKMWYISGSGWYNQEDKKKPFYKINYAESKDMIKWEIIARDIIPTLSNYESPSRPCVLKHDDKYEMFFSSMDLEKNNFYQLQYAISNDGINWKRESISIDSQENMLCYPFVFDNKFMLINGSNYGEKDILLYERE